MRQCHQCGAPWESETKIPGVKECCEQCNAYLHCCRNCRFHTPAKHNQCEVSNADWVGDRIRANFCDHFEFRQGGKDAASSKTDTAARDVLGRLFGESEPPAKKPKSLDDLFGG